MGDYVPSYKAKTKVRARPKTRCRQCPNESFGYDLCVTCYAGLCEFAREDDRPATDDRWRKGGG